MKYQPAILRSYEKEVLEPCRKLRYKVQEIGADCKENPLLQITTPRGNSSSKNVLLSAGVHGSEPAGVMALIDFLKNHVREYTNDFQFHVYPCINPSGYERNTRDTAQGINPNKEFKKGTTVPESNSFIKSLRKKYLFSIDHHETNPFDEPGVVSSDIHPQGCYLYEAAKKSDLYMGKKIILRLRKEKFPISYLPTIYGDKNDNGLITPASSGESGLTATLSAALDAFMIANHTQHAFTFETPTHLPLQQRIDAHITVIKTVLEHYKKEL